MRAMMLSVVLAWTASSPAVAQAERAPEHAASAFIHQMLGLINDYRQQHGLPPLQPAAELADLAEEHSLAMAAQQVLTHAGFRDRYARSGSKVCVENLAWNHRTPRQLLDGWLASPSHHRNLLNPKVVRVGLAARQRYVTFFACR